MPQDNKIDTGSSFYRLLAITCLITFASYLALSMRLPVVPLYALELDISTAQIGIINSSFYLMAGLLSLPLGLVSDIIGRKWLSISGLVVINIGLCLLFLSRSYLQLTGIYLLLGIGISAFGPTMMSFVAKISPPTHLGRAYGWYTTALFCGLSLGPAMGGAIGQWLGLRPVFLISAGICTINIILVIKFLPLRSPERSDDDKNTNWLDGLQNLSKYLPLIGCWAVTFGACITAGLFFTFIPLHAKNNGLEVGYIGIIFFSQALINALSRIPFGYFSDRVAHRKYLVIAGIVFLAFSIAGFSLTHTFYHFLITAVCLGASMGLAFTSIGALIAETVPEHFRGLAMGGYNTCIYLGMMTGSIAFGPIIQTMGYSISFLMAASLNLIFIFIFYWFMRGFRTTFKTALQQE